jgi:hypothetical protein
MQKESIIFLASHTCQENDTSLNYQGYTIYYQLQHGAIIVLGISVSLTNNY